MAGYICWSRERVFLEAFYMYFSHFSEVVWESEEFGVQM